MRGDVLYKFWSLGSGCGSVDEIRHIDTAESFRLSFFVQKITGEWG